MQTAHRRGPIRRGWLAAALVLAALLGLAAWVGLRVQTANAAYAAAVTHVESLRSLATTDPSRLNAAQLEQAHADLTDLRAELVRLDEATAVPVGGSIVGSLPWLGPRYRAVRDVLQIGLVATDTGEQLAQVGAEVVRSTDHAGASNPGNGPTWLDALQSHQAQLIAAAQAVDTLRTLRARLDPELLPDRARTRLAELDRLLDRPELATLSTVNLSAAFTALGGGPTPARYLVAFQNPAELRPTGGFPGTMALVTLSHGQLQSYQFFDAHELTDDYVAHRPQPLPQPWPIEHFFPQNGFLLHDALWWPDFPRSAQQLMAMYAQTGWPPIDGVIALQPSVASDLLRITGPFSVEFGGERRTITADNVYAEIDRQRRTDISTREDLLVHKEMLGLIGKNLIERLKSADRGALVAGIRQLAAACQRRDIQVYAADPAVESELDRQHCTGRLIPEPGQPTLAVTYANMVLAKNSMDMRPRLTLTAGPSSDGRREMQLDIDLRDGAVADEDPVYAGFQRWWVSVQLPDGSTLLSEPGQLIDPDAPNGGSYLAALFPDQTGRITLRFSMPDSTSLLVRRQPGVSPGDVTLDQPGCAPPVETELESDVRLDLAPACTA